MLQQFVDSMQPEYLLTYTRNPRIIRMLGRVSDEIYPLAGDEVLRTMAAAMDNASVRQGIAYHLNRYEETGLFRGDDPADSSVGVEEASLKQRYEELMNIRHALIVAARVRRKL